MHFVESRGLKYLKFDSLSAYGIRHGIFTRHGGVSTKQWQSLNTGAQLGDALENVLENKRRILQEMGTDQSSLCEVWQIHSDSIVDVKAPRHEAPITKADGMISRCSGITLLMRFADCVPVFLYDPKQHVIGIAHAGWKGAAKRIAAKAALEMMNDFSSREQDIIACIGPSIGPDHYEVGTDVLEAFSGFSDEQRNIIFEQKRNRFYLDLWKSNEIALGDVGISTIKTAAICTACNTSDWYSHRAEKGNTGRFAAVIGL